MRQRSIWGSLLLALGGTLLCIVCVFFLFTGYPGTPPPAQTPVPTVTLTSAPACAQETFQTGVVFPRWSPQGYGSTDIAWQAELSVIREKTAACWLEIPVLFSQDAPSATNVKLGKSTPTVTNFTHGIRAAHTLGFHVFFSPLVNITGPQTWAGAIQLETYKEQQQWFASYWQTLKPYMTVAQEAGVEQVAIGTEEEWLQKNAPDSLWNGLIANVRSVYSGTITYNTNWSDLQTPPPAWMRNAELKMIGVSEYISLIEKPMRVEPEKIPALWKEKVQPQLDNFATMVGKPIFLSEVGFRNSSDGMYNPWDSKSSASADPEVQAAGCNAVLVNSLSDPHILGSFFWGWDNVGSLKLKDLPAATVLHNHYAPLHK